MLSRYFGFQQEPFGTNPDPQYLYHSPTHREALASLFYGFHNNRGFTSLIAPPGMGKTTLLFRFLEDIRNSARTVFLFDTQCEPRELFGYILRDLDITPGQDAVEMHEQLNDVLVAEALAGRKFVLVIDEAQNLSDAALEMVRLLTNFETPQAKLMQIVLAGQPQLSDTLMKPSLLQLRQRISTFCKLTPFSQAETTAYIEHRLKRAGYFGEQLFTKEAVHLIAEASQGIPRTINNLCFNALSLCVAMKKEHVDDSMVAEAIADLQLIPQTKEPVQAVVLSQSKPFAEAAAIPQSGEPAEAVVLAQANEPVEAVAIPQTRELFKSFAEVPNEAVSEAKERKQTPRFLRFGVPIAAALLAVSVLSALAYTQLVVPPSGTMAEYRSLFRVPQFGKTAEGLSSTQKVPPALVPAPATTESGKTEATISAPSTAPFSITVDKPGQTLRDISNRYLGGYDPQRLEQIQTLNPKLTDPDYVELGQTIWLPGPQQEHLATNATTLATARKLP